MIASTRPFPGRARTARGGPSRLRLAVCALTIAACVPYLVLKAVWLSGSTAGWNDADAARESGLYVGNVITMGMDALVVLVALAFTFRWGTRLPAWLVLTPVWVATGLLAPIVLAVPLGTLLQTLLSTEPVTGADNGLQGWVYGVVYSGFIGQGIGLLTAFVLYARHRWPDVFAARTGEAPRGATHRLQVLLAYAGGVFAAVYAAARLFWAFGGTAGLHADQLASRTVVQQFADGVWGLLALAGAAALVVIVRRGRRPRRLVRPLTAAWTGASATFAWSLYWLLVMLGVQGDSTAAVGLTALCGLLGGLLMGLAGAMLLAEGVRPEGQSARPIASSAP